MEKTLPYIVVCSAEWCIVSKYMHMWFLCLDLFKRTRFLRFQSHNTWDIEIVLPHRIFVVNIYMIGQSGKVETESGQTTLKNLYHYLNSLDLHEMRNAVFLCNIKPNSSFPGQQHAKAFKSWQGQLVSGIFTAF